MTRKDLLMETTVQPVDRLHEHIIGVRRVIDWLAEHPELDLAPRVFETGRMHAYVGFESDPGAAEEFAAAVRALMAGAPIGSVRKTEDENYTRVTRDFGGVTFQIYTARAVTCEAVVVGQETVEVPDPEAPKVTITRDVVEWKCSPILAAAEPEEAAV